MVCKNNKFVYRLIHVDIHVKIKAVIILVDIL